MISINDLRPILVVNFTLSAHARIRDLLEDLRLQPTDEQVKKLYEAFRPLPDDDRELFGRLVDAVQIDWEAIGVDRNEHLKELVECYKVTDAADERWAIERMMMLATNGLDEHPEWFDYPCLCDTCRSYA